jgi:hypothetical protein
VKESFLDEKLRAEDILLGALGYGAEATILEISSDESKYWGSGKFADGEIFQFQSEDELTEIEKWAITVLSRPI